jgi:hypothetical protein
MHHVSYTASCIMHHVSYTASKAHTATLHGGGVASVYLFVCRQQLACVVAEGEPVLAVVEPRAGRVRRHALQAQRRHGRAGLYAHVSIQI